MFKITLIIVLTLSSASIVNAGTYYADPDGAAEWANCEDAAGTPGPKSGAAACSMEVVMNNAMAGDLVFMRGGTYSTPLIPKQTGTCDPPSVPIADSCRIIFQAYPGETPVISNATRESYVGVKGIVIDYSFGNRVKSYIKIDGLTIESGTTDSNAPIQFTYGANHIEVTNCIFDGNHTNVTARIWNGNDSYPSPTHNWFHNNTFKNLGHTYEGVQSMGFQIGSNIHDTSANYNTFDNNTLYCNGHHNLETFGEKTVIRNNFMFNHGCMTSKPDGYTPLYGPDTNALYGHRNIQIYDGIDRDGVWNLIEGNRFGPAGSAPENDGGDGFTLTAPKNILRYNTIYYSLNNGLLMKLGTDSYSDNNTIYNNTIYGNGRYDNRSGCRTDPPGSCTWQGYGIRFYDSGFIGTDNTLKNNIIYGNSSGDITAYSGNVCENNWTSDNATPLFIDGTFTPITEIQTITIPNLNLKSGSPAIDGGTYLTTAHGDNSTSTTLVVHDAKPFQDGTWGSDLTRAVNWTSPPTSGMIYPDWIAIGTVTNVVQISSIDYATNTITLASPMTWEDDAPIWLYKKSDGEIVLYGNAPDYGAYEYVPVGQVTGSFGGNLR